MKQQLEQELTELSKKGILLYIDGYLSSPREIAACHYVEEKCTYHYMTDRVIDEDGKWTEMHFNKLKNED